LCRAAPGAAAIATTRICRPRTDGHRDGWDAVLARLRRRVGLIDAVVFSGGEPTMDPCLADAMRIQEVRALGFGIGLHTGGMYPRRLAEVLPWVDWVGMDIKATQQGYDAVTRVTDSARAPWTSAELVLASGVAHESGSLGAAIPGAVVSRFGTFALRNADG
jgi:pyruvate formate lyase activating enzyme